MRDRLVTVERELERLIHAAPEAHLDAGPAAGWLLESDYVIRRTLRLCRADLGAGRERRLPRLATGDHLGLPRVFALAHELVGEAEGALDEDELIASVAAFVGPPGLSIGELWALPVTLRLAVLERLSVAARELFKTPGRVPGDAQTRDCIRALHTLEKLDWRRFFEATSRVEHVLRADPADVYVSMDFSTRDSYRQAVEQIAAGSHKSEEAVARGAIEAANRARPGTLPAHIGYHLCGDGRLALERALGSRMSMALRLKRACWAHSTRCYLLGVGTLTVLQEGLLCVGLVLVGAGWLQLFAAAILALVPAITVGVALTNWLVTTLLPPRVLPKLCYEEGLPRRCRTLVAVPCLLSSTEAIAELLERLEVRYLGKADPEMGFALLSDFLDADSATTPRDSELLRVAVEGLAALNGRHACDGTAPFHLLHRQRRWSQNEGRWMGWERKRGKLEELNRLLLGGGAATSFIERAGDAAFLTGVRFVIPLDADTQLPPGTARRLIASLDHPLNRAVFDEASGRVVSGYTVLQPRVEVAPGSESSSFMQLFSGDTVLDLYSRAVSDAYQDLFGEGTYVGKGIYEVRSFERSLRGRVPENVLLSHDLFEGLHGRAGLLSDVVVFEEYPRRYLAFTRRLHRWVRGDWQLLPWLGRRVPTASSGRTSTRLSLFARWRILDNLRRSLLAPALLAFLILSWALLPVSLLLTVCALGVLALPALVGFFDGMLRSVRSGRPGPLLDSVLELRRGVGQWFLRVAFLPYEGAVCCDAIVRTLVRLFTRRKLLEWTPAAQSERSLDQERGQLPVWVEMRGAPLFALAVALLLELARPLALPWVAPLLLAWGLSPALAAWVSRAQRPASREPDEAFRRRLRRLARRTWLFFEQFVGPADQWLPPDNVQAVPGPAIAHRTSPTNIGLLLTSTVAALDLGYVGPRTLAVRMRNTLDSLRRLELHEGHPLNWYDTRTLQALEPRYVSTVDNGNLAASLMVVERACLELVVAAPRVAPLWAGLLDVLDLCHGATQAIPPSAPRARALSALRELEERALNALTRPPEWSKTVEDLLECLAQELDQALNELLAYVAAGQFPQVEEAALWSGSIRRHLELMQAELAIGRPWREPLDLADNADPAVQAAASALSLRLDALPPLGELADACQQALATLDALEAELDRAGAPPQRGLVGLRDRLRVAGEQSLALVLDLETCLETSRVMLAGLDFGLLYDRRKHLLHIGLRVSEERLDPNHYDLLASEARLASVVALARGHVPREHWLRLGRPLTNAGGGLALVSWSGTAFEYLMPTLWLKQAPSGLLDLTCRSAVREQIRYARWRGCPWGVSESGFYHFDAQQNYQYRAFGLPTLGLKRGLGDDLVVAPYASLLALPYAPVEVEGNLDRFQELGLLGRYGLYEAVDMTRARLEAGESQRIVRSYMAHHQGMILTAIDNHLNGDAITGRFHAAPEIKTIELLLHEGQPRRAPVTRLRADDSSASVRPSRAIAPPWPCARSAPARQAHALSNGRLTCVLTGTGGGYVNWRGLGLTPWHADPTLDPGGIRLYVRDDATHGVWTIGRDALPGVGVDVTLRRRGAEILHRQGDLTAKLSLIVAADADALVHQLRLTNHGVRPRRLTVCSYGEVLLADPAEGLRHPAFAKLFVESRYLSQLDALAFRRRPRAPDERTCELLHMLVSPAGTRSSGHESARDQFLGRGGSLERPAALCGGSGLSGTVGWTLDPVLALSTTLDVAPHATVDLAFITCAGACEADVLASAARLRSLAAVERARDESRLPRQGSQGGHVEAARLPHYQRLLSLLLYPHRSLRPAPEVLARNRLGPSRLWAHGISGDRPILVVRLADMHEVSLVIELLAAHELWRRQRLRIDLVLLGEEALSYESSLTDRIHRLIRSAGATYRLDQPGGVFVVEGTLLLPEERTLLLAAARVVLEAGEPLERQLDPSLAAEPPLPAFQPVRSFPLDPRPTPPLARPKGLLFDNGLGGFSGDGREYVLHLETGRHTPAPWANVITNRELGFLATEAGCGYTWSRDAGLNRITSWANDPVSDPPSEALYLRDEESGEVWSPTPLPAPGPGAYQVRHGAGYTTYAHHSHQLEQRLRLFVAAEDPVKVYSLELVNTSRSPRRLTVTLLVEWILGRTRSRDGPHLIPEYDTEHEVLLARNPWNEPFAERVTFMAASRRLHGLTADRGEFLGLDGERARPQALGRVGLSGTVAAGRDPCGALQVHLDLPGSGRAQLHFALGQTDSREGALALARRYRDPRAVEAEWASALRGWDELLDAVQVQTPDPALDLLVNRWLLYQTVASRLWGRTGLYQSSGAYGFRDQLQDALALVHTRPGLLREQLLRVAARQFREGDVLHWWHAGTCKGLRSRCSDDLLWLPYAVAHYVETTGDRGVLDVPVPFLGAPPLGPEEIERYAVFEVSEEQGTLYEHCLAAIEHGSTAGVRGLPLFGTGDWNDGMNQVGAEGRGESVWLGWFLYTVLSRFAPLCEAVGDHEPARGMRRRAVALARALEEHGWDDAWYVRGFYDDGTALGSGRSQECRIDAIAQAWSALSGGAEPLRARAALEQAWRFLVQEDSRLVLLLTPPFERTAQEPGYIKAYAPGVRENGGQYTHAATWLGWAFSVLGDGDRAYRIVDLLSPIRHTDTPARVATYRVEPYALAGDVYAVPPHVGRGGWTWYTGSAAWLYRLAVEAILGLRREEGGVRITPCLPRAWPGFEATLRCGAATYRISVENNGGGRDVVEARCDGVLLEAARVALEDDGREHHVMVRLA